MAAIIDLNPRATTSYGMPYDILVIQSPTQAHELEYNIYEKCYEDRYLGTSQCELSPDQQERLRDLAAQDGTLVPISSLSANPPRGYLAIPFVSADGNTYAIRTEIVAQLADDWDDCVDIAHRFLDDDNVADSDRAPALVDAQALAAALRIHGGGMLALQLFFLMSLYD